MVTFKQLTKEEYAKACIELRKAELAEDPTAVVEAKRRCRALEQVMKLWNMDEVKPAWKLDLGHSSVSGYSANGDKWTIGAIKSYDEQVQEA